MASIEIAIELTSSRRERPVDEAAGERRANHHETEFAARPEQQRHFRGDARGNAESARQREQDEAP